MNGDLCDSCGERNDPHTAFCHSCGNYLGWDTDEAPEPEPAETEVGAPSASSAPSDQHQPDSPAADLRVTVEGTDVVLTPGHGPVPVRLHIANQSTIVDAYRVWIAEPPSWLQAEDAEVRLLPGTDESVELQLSILAENLVPVQRIHVPIRVQSQTDASLSYHAEINLGVGVVKGPVGLHLEPSTVRAKDSKAAQFRVLVDNSASNESLWASLTGGDPEHAVRFTFSPQHIDVPPGRSMAARLSVEAPVPEPGQVLNRALTITAAEGQRKVEASATFIQSSSAEVTDPPMSLRLDPTVVRVQNSASGQTRVIADNRAGTREQRISLTGYDDERVVEFSFAPPSLAVPPGQTMAAQVQLRAPRPGSGEEAERALTVSAWDGEQTLETAGTFQQVSQDRRPLLRVLFTVLGAFLMFLGVFLPWTSQPTLDGNEWIYPIYAQAFGFDGLPDVTNIVPGLLVSGGIVVVLLAIAAALGLVGTTGKLTRVAAALGLLWIIAFVVILSFTRFDSGASIGAFVVGVGCVTAFVGGLLARR